MPARPTACEAAAGLFDLEPGGPGALEAWARARGWQRLIGVDEVGRGPLAGPVVAGAVLLGAGCRIDGLADSKLLSPARREELAGRIQAEAEACGLGLVGPTRIDETDIRRASLEAMGLALAELLGRLGRSAAPADAVLVDGRDVFPLPPGSPPLPVRAFVRGDRHSLAIAAASILAKVHRDRLMDEYHARWPVYGFDRHKGYPTARHRRALVEHGPCEIHRRSFRGVPPAG